MAEKTAKEKARALLNNKQKEHRKRHGGCPLTESKYSKISDWISTGDMGLNRIISGSVYHGIPSGRVTMLSGESQSGKSFVTSKIIENALVENNYDLVDVLDSEGGMTDEMFSDRVTDEHKEKIEHTLIETVEDFAVIARKKLNLILEVKKLDPDFKALMIVDSIGMLPIEKILKNLDDQNRLPADQGTRAKILNSAIQALMTLTVKADVPLVLLNHVYDDPSGMVSKIKSVSGGKRATHSGHVCIQTSKIFEKDPNRTLKNGKPFYQSTVLKMFTTKNRVVKPFYETDIYLSYSNGLQYPYFGLWKPCMDYGIIKSPKQGWYTIPIIGDKSYRRADILKNVDNVWDIILPEFEKMSIPDMQYASGVDEELEEFDNMIEEIDNSDNESDE